MRVYAETKFSLCVGRGEGLAACVRLERETSAGHDFLPNWIFGQGSKGDGTRGGLLGSVVVVFRGGDHPRTSRSIMLDVREGSPLPFNRVYISRVNKCPFEEK